MRVGRSLDESLRSRVFDIVSLHALKGDPKVRLTPVSDLLTLRQFLSGPGPFTFFDMPWAPVYLAVIFLLHPVLGFASTVAVVLLAALAILNNRLIRQPPVLARAVRECDCQLPDGGARQRCTGQGGGIAP